MQNTDVKKRREFIKNSLAAGAVGALGVAALATHSLAAQDEQQSGVIKGKSKKNEVLYKPTAAWKDYYNVAK